MIVDRASPEAVRTTRSAHVRTTVTVVVMTAVTFAV
jgi:cytochrome bd-type quinol oxidase subunit 2